MSPTPLEQLLIAISDVDIREEASCLITLGTNAVGDLAQLDERIYQHHESDAGILNDEKTAVPVLTSLSEDVLRGVRALEAHLRKQTKAHSIATKSQSDEDMDFSFDFETGTQVDVGPRDMGDSADSDDGFDDFGDFGEFDAVETKAETSSDDESVLAELDLDDAFNMLGAQPEKSCQERWQSLQGEFESFAYALGSQIGDFDTRFVHAMDDGRFSQALRELNDVGRSVTDGVFALMITVYEAFLGEVDRDGVLPGHKSTLARALAVRRGLTDLRETVHSANTVLQSDVGGSAPQDEAFSEITRTLEQFVHGDVFSVMRPADRLELKSFLREIQGNSRDSARFDCEGLDKYLDSLAAVSQRDVLITHDREQLHEIRELLEAIKPLLEISPHGAIEMIEQAFQKAAPLYGVRDSLDALLAQWSELEAEKRSDATEATAMSRNLENVVREMA